MAAPRREPPPPPHHDITAVTKDGGSGPGMTSAQVSQPENCRASRAARVGASAPRTHAPRHTRPGLRRASRARATRDVCGDHPARGAGSRDSKKRGGTQARPGAQRRCRTHVHLSRPDKRAARAGDAAPRGCGNSIHADGLRNCCERTQPRITRTIRRQGSAPLRALCRL